MANPQYGSQVAPNAPVQDMTMIDNVAGTFPPQDQTASAGAFTGGIGDASQAGPVLGGTAETPPDGGIFYERIGF